MVEHIQVQTPYTAFSRAVEYLSRKKGGAIPIILAQVKEHGYEDQKIVKPQADGDRIWTGLDAYRLYDWPAYCDGRKIGRVLERLYMCIVVLQRIGEGSMVVEWSTWSGRSQRNFEIPARRSSEENNRAQLLITILH